MEQLKVSIDSIARGTRCPHEIIVIDGGSTDGTIEYLKSRKDITPVFQGKLLGTARCYNEVWRQVRCKYTTFWSDDTELMDGSLDLAAEILESNPSIGLVGLKMKDTIGPKKVEPYLGGLSEYGVLNCNHGFLSMKILKAVGYFNEGYRSYTIDTDLTTSVLCCGKTVVMTKQISVMHHREWAEREKAEEKINSATGGIDNGKIYREKFKFLGPSNTLGARLRAKLIWHLACALSFRSSPGSVRFGLNSRDWHNLAWGRYIRLADPLENMGRPYYLVQRIPRRVLLSEMNPYRHLVTAGNGQELSAKTEVEEL